MRKNSYLTNEDRIRKNEMDRFKEKQLSDLNSKEFKTIRNYIMFPGFLLTFFLAIIFYIF